MNKHEFYTYAMNNNLYRRGRETFSNFEARVAERYRKKNDRQAPPWREVADNG